MNKEQGALKGFGRLIMALRNSLFLVPCSIFILSLTAFSQEPKNEYDTDLLPKEFHQGRRDSLRKLMPDSSVAVFFANPVRNRANDVDYLYSQDPNFYYLTGLTEPNSMLILFKEKQEIGKEFTNEIIFVQHRDPKKEAWNGRRLGVDGVKQKLGFKVVKVNNEFADLDIDFSKFRKVMHLKFYDDVRDDKDDRGDLYSLIRHFRSKTEYKRKNKDDFELSLLMARLREVKTTEELILMRKAINMTCDAHAELMRSMHPGMKEYQAQAVVEYIFKKNGSEYPGFPSIVGGGENSCILHYNTNRKALSGKNILVCDIGAEYHGYTADVTRTMPVDGKFSEQEKIIYNIVLEAQTAGIKACKPGAEFRAAHKAAQAVIQKRLLELQIIKKPDDFLTFFFHGTSHYLGLDVHDAGLFGRLAPGNVITVEPGVYIPAGSDCDPKWWDIGVRIEDDILIREDGCEVMSACVPKTIEEIEALMQQNGLFKKK